ncbi:uncharacterized protein LOC128993359 isoform X1 [Macrosteles quadrilineatus]|uniref:uncharacterized protein LOC128993359 isoform X1 n=1 Tax=Macrosteles quadrilineatus TaxID=74068 RepID=UPI0023E110DF|nr:uncharacterized protein LOC128993359 isoform X1 [Macrosteles quadrilineatus]
MGHCTVFVCPSGRGSSDSAPTHRARPSLLKWVISLLVCCWGSRSSRNSGDNGSENIEMGPMTLREYIATLEPYDPEIHGWRGDEPLTVKRRTQKRNSNHRLSLANGGLPGSSGDSPAYSSVSYHPRQRGSVELQSNNVI